MVAYGRCYVPEGGDALHDVRADTGMRAHECPLGVVQRARLGQYLLGDGELSDVVQPSGEPAALGDASRQ